MKTSDRIVLWSILILSVASTWATWLMLEYPTLETIKSIILTFSIIGLVVLVIALVVEAMTPTRRTPSPARS